MVVVGLQPRVQRDRLVLVEHLRAENEDPVPLLCEYLADPQLRVRIAAAKTLVEVGDERAVAPLCRVLETNTRRLPLWLARVVQALSFVGLGILFGTVLLAVTLGFIWLATVDQGAWMGFSTVLLIVFPLAWSAHDGGRDRLRSLWLDLMSAIGGQDDLVESAADALTAICGRSQGAAVRKSLPLLRRVCADRLIHRPSTRQAAARASARIQMATSSVRRLPIASAEPSQPSTKELPVPYLAAE